jgi:hypothetical protein
MVSTPRRAVEVGQGRTTPAAGTFASAHASPWRVVLEAKGVGQMTPTPVTPQEPASVDLYWMPLGAGGARCVRWSGRRLEALVARHEHRPVRDLYHSALVVRLGTDRFVIEMAPVWSTAAQNRGVVGEGAVGLPWLGFTQLFRYEVRCWCNGVIPDIAEAVASPQRLSSDGIRAQRVLELVPAFPLVTWGLDELHTGDMWNSNSLIAWLLARSGHDTDLVRLPRHGRAPGWSAGLVVAARDHPRQRDRAVALVVR